MAKIAVDLDSTLYDFETPAREAFLKLAEKYDNKDFFKGAYDPWTQWRSPADALGTEIWLEVIALCHETEIIRQQRPFPGSVETCQALIDEGHELLYISNRATESQEATEAWLFEWGFLHAKLADPEPQVVCMMEDKKPYLADCQYLIDDRPKTCMDFIYDFDWEEQRRAMARKVYESDDYEEPTHADIDAQGTYDSLTRRAFMKSYPYNQNFTDIPHVYLAPTWAGLNYYMVGKGVLSKPAHTALETA